MFLGKKRHKVIRNSLIIRKCNNASSEKFSDFNFLGKQSEYKKSCLNDIKFCQIQFFQESCHPIHLFCWHVHINTFENCVT